MYKLLLVEDEQIERMYIQKIVGSHFPAITRINEARNGREAVQMAGELQPDIIIMDIRMPEMNGLIAGEEIRRVLPNSKIVFLSAYDSFDYAQTAIKLAAYEYLLKPVRPQKLVHTLQQIIDAIDSERLKEEEENRLKAQLEKQTPLVMNSFLQDLLNGEIYDQEELQKKTAYLNIEIPPSSVFLINIRMCSGQVPIETSKQYPKHQVISKLIKHFNSDTVFALYTGSDNFVLLHGKKEGETNRKAADIARGESIIELLADKGRNIINVAIGNLYQNVLDIPRSYSEAKKAILYKDDFRSQVIHADNTNNQYHQSIIAQVRKYIEDNAEKEITLDIIARQVHLSPFYLCRLFKSQTGMNIISYLNILRIKKSMELLESTDLSIDMIAERVGYNDASYYCRMFKRHLGHTPDKWRKKRKKGLRTQQESPIT